MTRGALALAVPLLGACAFGDSYPARWEPLAPAPSAGCRHFEGQYAEQGERPDGQSQAFLSALFFGSPNAGASRLSIALRGDEIEIAVWAKDDPVPLYKVPSSAAQGGLVCDNGTLVNRKRRWINEGQFHGWEGAAVEFSATRDSLIVRAEESGVGLAVVFPVIASQTRWYRFRRLND